MKTLRVLFQSIECPSTIHSVSFNTSATWSMPKSSILAVMKVVCLHFSQHLAQ